MLIFQLDDGWHRFFVINIKHYGYGFTIRAKCYWNSSKISIVRKKVFSFSKVLMLTKRFSEQGMGPVSGLLRPKTERSFYLDILWRRIRDHKTGSSSSLILVSDWSRRVTWRKYWAVIGRARSRDMNTELWLVDGSRPVMRCHAPKRQYQLFTIF